MEFVIIGVILGIPVYFFWRWCLKKIVKSEKIRRIVVWPATIVTLPVVYGAIVVLVVLLARYHPTHDFDRKRWLADKEKRYELSEDIIDRKMLIGKTKAEVRQILGDEGNKDENSHWSYYLGFHPKLFGIDPDFLYIYFEDGKVVSVSQPET